MHSAQDRLDQQLQDLQHRAFGYFQDRARLAREHRRHRARTSSYPVAVERGLMTMRAAVERTLATLRFFWKSPQGPEPDATGYRGFY